jgi:protein TonB
MNKQELTELIQLYSAGCIKKQDLQKLRSPMQEDQNFPWLELSEYQNLVALLPVILKKEEPTVNARNKVVYKMNELEETPSSDDIENDTSEQKVQNVFVSEEKIDWGSLSLPQKKIQKSSDAFNSDLMKTYTQVQPPSKILSVSKLNIDDVSDETINLDKGSGFKKDPAPQHRFKKYHFAIVGLFLSAILFGGYLYLGGSSNDKTELPKVKTQPPKISVQKPEPDKTEKIIGVVNVGELEPITEKESEPQIQIQEEILPPPPPEFSSPIEYPPEQFVENYPVVENKLIEETKTEDQKPVPPPKEEMKEEEPSYFVAVEEMPEPIGGLQSIQEKVDYPEIARRAGIEGKVFVRAYVDETGLVKRAEVIKGIGLGCDEAALNAVLNTKFKPGKQRGKLIKVQIVIPIVFKR